MRHDALAISGDRHPQRQLQPATGFFTTKNNEKRDLAACSWLKIAVVTLARDAALITKDPNLLFAFAFHSRCSL